MGTIADKLAYLAGTKTAIKNAIRAMGVSVDDADTFRSYADKVQAIDYIRPADWLSLPDMSNGEQKVVMLWAVFENGMNGAAVRCDTSSGNYHVDWGDGTTSDAASGTTAEHLYTYDNLSDSTICSRGYKQAIITITPISGNILTFKSAGDSIKYSGYPATAAQGLGLLDVKVAGQYITQIKLGVISGARNVYLEKFEFVGTCNLTSCALMFGLCYALQKVIGINTSKVTDFTYMFYNCNSLSSVPALDTSLGTTFVSMFQNCFALKSVPAIDVVGATDVNSMYSGCQYLDNITINTSTITKMTAVASSCYKLRKLELNLASMVDNTLFGTSIVSNCFSLRSLRLYNMGSGITTVSVSISGLDRTALVALFNDLYNRTSLAAGTITITNAVGASALTAADRAIATNKNWTIVG